ncbi:MAG TPA: PA2779 family protein [Acidobacteriaceae bacterium]|nr:PA2779 family protein [Acidobacteriaceae bacterium]
MQSRRTFRSLALGLAAAAMLTLAPALFAQQPAAPQDGHLVSPAQLQQQMESASAARQENIDTLTRFLSTPTAVRAMKSRGIDPVQVKSAIPNLSNAELASLSARAERAQQKFAAGNLSNNDLLIIILVLVVVILLVVIH